MSQPNQHPLSPKEAVMVEAPPESVSQDVTSKSRGTISQKVYDCVTYVPARCRYDPEKPFEFSMGLNVLFGKNKLAVCAIRTLTVRAW